MLATSLAVVRKMLDAVAGSAPSRFSVERDQRAGEAADDAARDHREHHDQAHQQRMGLALHGRIDHHAERRP